MIRLSTLLTLYLLTGASFTTESWYCRRSGLKGHIYFEAGNRIPSPDSPPSNPKGYRTTLYIYELTNTSQVNRNGATAFYKSISTKLVKTVESADDGAYQVKLKPGRYSLFVKKGELFYANLFDGENNIYPVEVAKGKWTEENVKVNYDAVY